MGLRPRNNSGHNIVHPQSTERPIKRNAQELNSAKSNIAMDIVQCTKRKGWKGKRNKRAKSYLQDFPDSNFMA